jgi:hypothetical protein
MPDYQKGKIYKLYSPSKNLVYYGSTVKSLPARLANHTYEYRTKPDRLCKGHLVLECADYKIELIEDFPCNNKQQLERREGEYIKNNECVNKYVAGRTIEEYRNDNKQKITEYRKNYEKENREQITIKHKQYLDNNRAKYNEYMREYRLTNKEKINEQRRLNYKNS